MKTKRRAYALTEMLVIIVMVAVLMGLFVRPFRTMISEIPRSARVCQTLNGTMKALAASIQAVSVTWVRDTKLPFPHPLPP